MTHEICPICGTPFVKTTNQKYCVACRERVKKSREAAWKAAHKRKAKDNDATAAHKAMQQNLRDMCKQAKEHGVSYGQWGAELERRRRDGISYIREG